MKNRMDLSISDYVLNTWQHAVDLTTDFLNVQVSLIIEEHEEDFEVLSSSKQNNSNYRVGIRHKNDSSDLFCEHVVSDKKMYCVSKTHKNAKGKANLKRENQMVSYIGFRVNWPDGSDFGTICAMDNKEREFNEEQIDFIKQMSVNLEASLKDVYDNRLIETAKEEIEAKNKRFNSYMEVADNHLKMIHFSKSGKIEPSSNASNSFVNAKDRTDMQEFLPKVSNHTYNKILAEVDYLGHYDTEIEIDTIKSKSSKAIIYLKKNDVRYTMIFNDITNFNYYDSMPNRKALMKKVDDLILNNKEFYLAFADVDNLKNIKDLKVHSLGDVYLEKIGKRINKFVTDNISAYRWGGDVFVIIVETESQSETIVMLDQLLVSISKNIEIQGNVFNPSMSIGVVHYPVDSTIAEELIRKADVAKYMARTMEIGKFEFYDNKFGEKYYESIIIGNKMKQENFKDALHVYYQPKLNIKTNKITGVEALVRWIEPDFNFVEPDVFIPIAEKNAMISAIDQYVINKAFKEISEINKSRDIKLKIAVNLSTANINWNMIKFIKEQLVESEIGPENVEVEITETEEIKQISEVKVLLDALRNAGVSIVIDDFGQKFASLNYLLKLPVSGIKIDKEFTDHIFIDKSGAEIVKSIINLSKVLNKMIVAEGVETIEQLEYLKELGCDEYQGYLASRPIELEQLKILIKSHVCIQ